MALPILRSSAQYFRDANRGRVYVHVFISLCEFDSLKTKFV
jgi:hypothetical protein